MNKQFIYKIQATGNGNPPPKKPPASEPIDPIEPTPIDPVVPAQPSEPVELQ